jgi:fructose-1,6-bisphosphatase
MEAGRIRLSDHLSQQLAADQSIHRDLGRLIHDIATAVKEIALLTSQGALAGVLGNLSSQNVQGETQKKLDVLSDEILIETFRSGKLVAGIASEENDAPITNKSGGPFLSLFDPLDGSSNIDVNVSVGTIFSILNAPKDRSPELTDYLQSGRKQIAAGYAVYGPSTMLVLSIERFWEAPVTRYISECKKGKTDVRGRDFNMRWIASMVADVHRILMRGGIFMYPKDTKDLSKPGRLRLMYEANPMTFVVEQAGGLGSTGRQRILELKPESIHQRVPVILGSRNEVERLEQYHREFDQIN